MRSLLRVVAASSLITSLACAGSAGGSAEASALADNRLLITNAKIWGHPDADALLIAGDTIAAIGRTTELLDYGPHAPVIDARGGQVLPGFHDAHMHALGGGRSMTDVPLEDAKSLAEALASVKKYAAENPAEAWITGRGWMYEIGPRGGYPTAQDLDSVVADRPVFLRAYDGHSGWANSKALELAGITAATQDPADGTIVRGKDGKTPSGALLEGAMELVMRVIPEQPRAAKRAALERAMAHLLSLGVTAMDDIVADLDHFELYGEMEQEGRLPMRVTVSPMIEGDFDAYEKLRSTYGSSMLRFGFIKGFVDGVYESKTALVVHPYPGTKDERGTPLIPKDELYAYVKEAQSRGFSVALHACGDGGVRLSLDTFERVAKEVPKNGTRHRIEHIEILDPADAPRFAALDVVASMQPFHSTPSDGGSDFDDNAWARNVGKERLPLAFAWHDVLAAGGVLAFGSDWPVMSADPLWGLATATTRQNAEGKPDGGWIAAQKISVAQAIEAYGRGSAAGIRREGELGVIVKDQLADLVVLAPGVDVNRPATLWPGQRVQYTIVGGVVRFAARDAPMAQR